MKCKFDLSRFQWLNRELIPIESRYMWFKMESRFVQLFKKYEPSDEHLSPMHHMNNLVENNSSISYDINIIKILTQEDTRTMLMIRNIPNKFTKDHFLNIFNKHFESKFNLFLLPTDINEKKIMDIRLLILFIIIILSIFMNYFRERNGKTQIQLKFVILFIQKYKMFPK